MEKKRLGEEDIVLFKQGLADFQNVIDNEIDQGDLDEEDIAFFNDVRELMLDIKDRFNKLDKLKPLELVELGIDFKSFQMIIEDIVEGSLDGDDDEDAFTNGLFDLGWEDDAEEEEQEECSKHDACCKVEKNEKKAPKK